MISYDILKWDTDFFGFPVARITEKNVDEKNLNRVLNELKQQNVALAYFSTDSEDILSNKSAELLHGFLTGEKITYVLNLESFEKKSLPDDEIKKFKDDKPGEYLLDLIVEGGVYSRFYVDPKISEEQYAELHRLWITNSVKNNTIFTIEENNEIIAFVSLNDKNQRGNIDFIVVTKKHRGKGLATKLMNHAHIWFASKGYRFVQADTQKENINACKMYEKLGYKKEKTDKNYHFWL